MVAQTGSFARAKRGSEIREKNMVPTRNLILGNGAAGRNFRQSRMSMGQSERHFAREFNHGWTRMNTDKKKRKFTT
jgi:hypothetical protein